MPNVTSRAGSDRGAPPPRPRRRGLLVRQSKSRPPPRRHGAARPAAQRAALAHPWDPSPISSEWPTRFASANFGCFGSAFEARLDRAATFGRDLRGKTTKRRPRARPSASAGSSPSSPPRGRPAPASGVQPVRLLEELGEGPELLGADLRPTLGRVLVLAAELGALLGAFLPSNHRAWPRKCSATASARRTTSASVREGVVLESR